MSAEVAFDFFSAAASHVGTVRKLNEDALIERPEIGLWAVADGMGGHQAGDVASKMIIDLLAKIAPPAAAGNLLVDVQGTIISANQALREEAARREPGTVIGATVVALMMHGAHFACLWAGDSRLYRLRDGALEQLSHDHSQVQDLVDAGIITSEEAEHHPMSNVITRAVGAHEDLRLQRITGAIVDGDTFLACTDGLSKMVGDDEIAAILTGVELVQQPSSLVAAALAHGGKDNVTVVVVRACRRH